MLYLVLYLIISLAIAAYMAFAFALVATPLVVFLISFFVAFIPLVWMHTIIADESIFKFKFKKSINGALIGTIAIGVLLLLFIAVGVLLLIEPMLVYKVIHFGWIIGLFIVCPAILFGLTHLMEDAKKMHTAVAICYYIVCVALIPLMIVGVITSQSATYEIYTAEDMKVLGNAPITYDTAFLLQDDIDFTDEDVSSWFGRRKEFEGIFDGNGYTLSNIVLKTKDKKIEYGSETTFGFGFVRTNIGVIRNLNFENCRFTITFVDNEYRRSWWSNTYYFGTIAAVNYGGIISDCNIIDCQGKYITQSDRIEVRAFWDVGLNAKTSYYGGAASIEPLKNVNVINDQPLDESFYKEDDLEWKPIGIEEEKE